MDPRFFSSNDFHTTNLIIMSNTQLFYFWVAAFWSHSALHCFEKSSACVLHVLIWSNFCSAASLSLHSLNIFSDVVLHSLRHAVSASGGGGFGGSFSCLQADSPRSPTISITPARACQLFILSPLTYLRWIQPAREITRAKLLLCSHSIDTCTRKDGHGNTLLHEQIT